MSLEQLVAMTRREVENHQAGNRLDLAPEIYKIPTSVYYDPERWELEVERVFKRIPLALAFSCELREPGAYVSTEAVGVPVLITRGDDGVARAFVNMCSHRGALVAEKGCGETKGFRCGYHGWYYNLEGSLLSVFDNEMFGEVDKSTLGLTPLPTAERAGMIWVTLKPDSKVDIDAFLAGYDGVLDFLDFKNCHIAGRQQLEGPNWKVAFDGYRDQYHVPVLHRNSFGPDRAHRPDYYAWGPHVRMVSPMNHGKLADTPEDQWRVQDMITGVWTIFPNISIAAFDTGAKTYMVSQMFPGSNPLHSVTTQHFLRVEEPKEEDSEKIAEVMAFLKVVVGEEDYGTGLGVQQNLKTKAKEFSFFGRNEGGGQQFHRWVDALVAAEDADLPALLQQGI